MLLLVRHAHAGQKHRWPGPDTLRPLSAAGQAEAAGLLVRLEDFPVGRILSSPTMRCQQTVQPLADDRHLRVELLPALGVAADPAAVLALLADAQGQDALVCTHGEVIGEVLLRLVMDGLAVDHPLTWPKGSTWLLEGGGDGRFRFGRYLAPLHLDQVLTLPSAPRRVQTSGSPHRTAP
jgi:phosphohistidine phosphatase SixA